MAAPSAAGDLQVKGPAQVSRLTFQTVDQNVVSVSATDADGNPVRGLGKGDFRISSNGKEARILSVETMETRKDLPMNIVLVLDNSYSMERRNAVQPLLDAVDGFLQIVRPIDNVQVVVFDGKQTLDLNGRPMHARVLKPKSMPEIKQFLQNSYGEDLTDSTYLYEAMAVGIDLIAKTPDKKNRFLLVFSDGEDINSRIDRSFVTSMAPASGDFVAYTVDYMPAEKIDPFLLSFAESSGGTAWKAATAEQLVPIFKAFSTTLLHRYIITYRFSSPPTGTPAIEPAALHLESLTALDGSPVGHEVFFRPGGDEIPDAYVRFSDRSQAAAFQEDGLKTAMDRYRNVLNIAGRRLTAQPMARARIVGCNSFVGLERDNLDLSQRRALNVKKYLTEVWGIEGSRLELGIRNLPTKAAPFDVPGGPAENRRVEIVFDAAGLHKAAAEDFIVAQDSVEGIVVSPRIASEYGIATWELRLGSEDTLIKAVNGTGELPSRMSFTLGELGRQRLSALRSLKARVKVTDLNGDAYEASSADMPIRLSRRVLIEELIGPLLGTVAVEPNSLVIEEVTAIDSSPFLNYVYFDSSKSEIPERYVRYFQASDTRQFSEAALKGPMEKYLHILNVVGKRLSDRLEARLKIVGCNSGHGPERNNLTLSRKRAESVKAYLESTWRIDPSRMEVKSRNLPEAPSTDRVSEGRLENQRVELDSDAPDILDTVNSTYVELASSAAEVRVLPLLDAGYGVSSWQIDMSCDGTLLHTLGGKDDPERSYAFALDKMGLDRIAACKTLAAGLKIEDRKGRIFQEPSAAAVPVTFVKKEEMVAKKMGYRVVEKYGLILFDFDSAVIKGRNRVIVDRILERMKRFPSAKVKIVGHTDTIGTDEYNLHLSERRAKAVYQQLAASGAIAQTIDCVGAGPHDPPYDNALPEGRALNRTVTVFLEYETLD